MYIRQEFLQLKTWYNFLFTERKILINVQKFDESMHLVNLHIGGLNFLKVIPCTMCLIKSSYDQLYIAFSCHTSVFLVSEDNFRKFYCDYALKPMKLINLLNIVLSHQYQQKQLTA